VIDTLQDHHRPEGRMTDKLQEALAEASRLPEPEQNELAERILADVRERGEPATDDWGGSVVNVPLDTVRSTR
jgi:hypothetical protein